MGNDKKDFNSAADPAHPSSTGRVGGRGGITTAAEGESRMPETPFDSVTHEGENGLGHGAGRPARCRPDQRLISSGR
jgi:hypothetical protein